MNLVGPGDIEVHFVDSVRALGPLAPTGRWVDLGSGAGFPGLVLADRSPTVAIDLVERRRKRAVFLRQVVLEAGASEERIRVLAQGVDELPGGTYDGVLARAFASPAKVLEHSRRLLVAGGVVVLFLQEETLLPETAGFEMFHVEHYEVGDRRRRSVALRLQ